MPAKLFTLPFPTAFNSNGLAVPGAELYFYLSGTSTPAPSYTSDTLTVENEWPVQANGAGRFSSIYLDEDIEYRLVIKDRSGATLDDIDPYAPGTIVGTRGPKGPPGSGNIIGLSLDDYLTPDDDSLSTVAENNAGLAELNADIAAMGSVKITCTPGATYWVGGAANQPYSATEIFLLYNWYPTVPYLIEANGIRDLIIEGNGATFKNKGGYKYGTFDPVTGDPRGGGLDTAPMPYEGVSATGAATPFLAMVRAEGCTGTVEVRNLTLDGNMAGAELGGGYGDIGIQLGFSGVSLHENEPECTVLIENVTARNFGLDGIHIDEGYTTTAQDPHQRVAVLRCCIEDNGRNGISIVGGRGIEIGDFTINRNGFYSRPRAGIDIESEGSKQVRDTWIHDGSLIDNYGQAIVADSGNTHDILVERFLMAKFTPGFTTYVIWPNKPGFKFRSGTVLGSVVEQYAAGDGADSFQATQWEDVEFSNDPARSPTGTVITHNANGMLFDSGIAPVEFIRSKFVHAVSGTASNGNTDQMLYTDCTFIAKLGAVSFTGRVRGKSEFIEESTGVINAVPNAAISPKNSMGHAEDAWTFKTAAGSAVTYGPTIDQDGNVRGSRTTGSDADLTLTSGTDREIQILSGTLTANRAITLATPAGKTRNRFRILRTGGGAFNWSVGGLKTLTAANQWCEVEYSVAGSAWVLLAAGSL